MGKGSGNLGQMEFKFCVWGSVKQFKCVIYHRSSYGTIKLCMVKPQDKLKANMCSQVISFDYLQYIRNGWRIRSEFSESVVGQGGGGD